MRLSIDPAPQGPGLADTAGAAADRRSRPAGALAEFLAAFAGMPDLAAPPTPSTGAHPPMSWSGIRVDLRPGTAEAVGIGNVFADTLKAPETRRLDIAPPDRIALAGPSAATRVIAASAPADPARSDPDSPGIGTLSGRQRAATAPVDTAPLASGDGFFVPPPPDLPGQVAAPSAEPFPVPAALSERTGAEPLPGNAALAAAALPAPAATPAPLLAPPGFASPQSKTSAVLGSAAPLSASTASAAPLAPMQAPALPGSAGHPGLPGRFPAQAVPAQHPRSPQRASSVGDPGPALPDRAATDPLPASPAPPEATGLAIAGAAAVADPSRRPPSSARTDPRAPASIVKPPPWPGSMPPASGASGQQAVPEASTVLPLAQAPRTSVPQPDRPDPGPVARSPATEPVPAAPGNPSVFAERAARAASERPDGLLPPTAPAAIPARPDPGLIVEIAPLARDAGLTAAGATGLPARRDGTGTIHIRFAPPPAGTAPASSPDAGPAPPLTTATAESSSSVEAVDPARRPAPEPARRSMAQDSTVPGADPGPPVTLAAGEPDPDKAISAPDAPAPGLASPPASEPGAPVARPVAAGPAPGLAPDPILRQIVEAARAGPGPVEIRLTPDDLGTIRLSLHSADGALTVRIAAERPETLDMIRRHLPDLSRDLRDLGHQSLSFAFTEDRPDRPPARPGFAPPPDPGPPPDRPAPPPPSAAGRPAGLDLRF